MAESKVAESLTERQKKWFASVAASLERDTGKSLAQWVEIVFEANDFQPTNRVIFRLFFVALDRGHCIGGGAKSHIPDNQWGRLLQFLGRRLLQAIYAINICRLARPDFGARTGSG